MQHNNVGQSSSGCGASPASMQGATGGQCHEGNARSSSQGKDRREKLGADTSPLCTVIAPVDPAAPSADLLWQEGGGGVKAAA